MKNKDFQYKQGKRLRNVLNAENASNRKIKGSYIYKKYMSQYNDIGCSKVVFSNYLSGKKQIPTDLLIQISNDEYINIDSGYLLGDDDFKCENYSDYIEWKYTELNNKCIFNTMTPVNQLFKSIFKYMGYSDEFFKSFSQLEILHYSKKLEFYIEEFIIEPHNTTLTPSEMNKIIKSYDNYDKDTLLDETDNRMLGVLYKEASRTDMLDYWERAYKPNYYDFDTSQNINNIIEKHENK